MQDNKDLDEKLHAIGISDSSKKFWKILNELRIEAANHWQKEGRLADKALMESIIFTPIFCALENSIRFMYKNLLDVKNEGYSAYKKHFLDNFVNQLMELNPNA